MTIQTPFAFPWRIQALVVLPLAVSLLALWWLFGTETSLEAFFINFRLAEPAITSLVAVITDWGNTAFFLLFALFLRDVFRPDSERMHFLASFAIALALVLAIVFVMKGFVGRARPYLDPGFLPFSWINDYHSFPSGHTTEAVACGSALAVRYRSSRLAIVLGIAAAAIALSRIYLGVHFMTDVLGGVLMGVFASYLAWRFQRRMEHPENYCQSRLFDYNSPTQP